MPKTTRRTFLKTATIAGAGYFVAAGTRRALSQSANEKFNVACIGVGGKGGSDSNNAAQFGNVIAICDVDQNTLESKGNSDGFKSAEKFTDFRELLAKHGKNIQIATISTPDHMHAPATLAAMRLGISCYTQKPLTRTIYEARLMAQGRRRRPASARRWVIRAQLWIPRAKRSRKFKSGVLGTLKEVYAWSNRPIWAQGPDRRMTMEKFAAQAKKEDADDGRASSSRRRRRKSNAPWNDSTGSTGWASRPTREFWPGLYHTFQWRGWWDFGSGALGDMACHQLTVPFASCGLRDPISVVAKTHGPRLRQLPRQFDHQVRVPGNVRAAGDSVLVVRSQGQQAAARGVQQVGHQQRVRQRRADRRREGCLLQQRRLLRRVRTEGCREGQGRLREGREQGQQRPEQHVRVVPRSARGRSEDLQVELHRSGRPAHRNDSAGQPGRVGRGQGRRRTAKWATGARRSSGTPRTSR